MEPMPARTRLALAGLCAAAFALYSLMWPAAPAIDGDSLQYLEVARDLADGSLDELHDRTPGYPMLLALTGSTSAPTRSLIYVQLLLHLGSVWLLCLLCHRAGAPHRWILASAAILLLPPFIEPAASVMTETLAQALLVAGIWLLVTGLTKQTLTPVVLASVVFAYAALTRPVFQLLPLALAALILIVARAKWKAAAALVLGSSVVLGAYAWFNARHFGFFGVTWTAGFHLTTKTITFVERLPDEDRVVREILVEERNRLVTRRGGLVNPTQTIWHARERLQAATGLSQPELARHLLRLNLRLIRRAPVPYLQEVARSAAVYWFPAPTGVSGMSALLSRTLWPAAYVLIVGAFFLQLVMVAGLSRAGVSSPETSATALQIWAYALAVGVVFYTMALSCVLDIGEPRQRRPADVFLVLAWVAGALRYTRVLPAWLRSRL
jgi:hypothetical protein